MSVQVWLVLIGGGKKVGTNTYMLQKTYALRISRPIVRSPIEIVADFGRDIIMWMKLVVGMKCHAVTEGTIIQPRIVIAAVVCLCVNISTRTFIISWGDFFFSFFFLLPPPTILW